MSAPTTSTLNTLEAAREYLRRGRRVIPIPRGKKGPVLPEWPSLRLSEEDLPEYFSNGENIGMILGHASGGLVDVDLDCCEAIAVSDFFLPPSKFVFGRASKPRSHRFFICDPLPASQKCSAPDGRTLIELRGNRQQTVVPPSIHPLGERYEFEDDSEPARVDGDALAQAAKRIASAALIAAHWPRQGHRHHASLALAGMLIRGGWTQEETAVSIEAAATAAGDEETRARIRNVASSAKRIAADERATGALTLAEIIGPDVVERAKEWLGLRVRVEVASATPSRVTVQWPESLAPEALHGLAGEAVQLIEPTTEADPAALLTQFLVVFGNIIGRGPHFIVERHTHYTNLFAVIVGATAKARKGTSWARIADLFCSVDAPWLANRIHGGVGSGEGVIWAVRDPISKGEKLLDEGIADKRLLLLETEFAQPLAIAAREGNTVSETLRRAWDGTPLQTLTKNNPARATDAHVSMIGHVTAEELRRHLSSTEVANGFANRFLFICARRSKSLPEGGSLDEAVLAPLIEKLRDAMNFACEVREMTRDSGARDLWHEVYEDLSEGQPGLLGAVVSRAEAQALRMSMIYALLDSSAVIRREHLLAALAICQYAEHSARYIFGDAMGDPVADEILRALRARQRGMTRTEIRDLFGRNRAEPEIVRALTTLVHFGLADYREENTGGRPAQRWFSRKPTYDKNDRNDKK